MAVPVSLSCCHLGGGLLLYSKMVCWGFSGGGGRGKGEGGGRVTALVSFCAVNQSSVPRGL